jgi:hypothetical protein
MKKSVYNRSLFWKLEMKKAIDSRAQAPETEALVKEQGYVNLDSVEIKERIIGKQFFGGYLHGFQYVISINENGSLEGKNNYQHYDVGEWTINEEEHTLSVKWQYGWDDTTTRLYDINGEISMYDAYTGHWRTVLREPIKEAINIEEYEFIELST